MGINSCDTIAAKRYICTTTNRSIGYNADGEKPSTEICTWTNGALCVGAAAIPAWQKKVPIKDFVINRGWSGYGIKQAGNSFLSSISHPNNFWNTEFLNGKISKMESLIAKNSQVGQYYGTSLNNMKIARTVLENGGSLTNEAMETLHKGYADARLSHNQAIRSGNINTKLLSKLGAHMTKGVKTAMAASKMVRSASRFVGKAGGWIAVGVTVVSGIVDGYAAWQVGKQTGNQWSCLGRQVLKTAGRAVFELGGSFAGAWAGAAIGQALIPIPGVGALIGGIVGGIVGFLGGSKAADQVPALQKSVAEEEIEKQAEEQKQALCNAIDAIDMADTSSEISQQSIEAYAANLKTVLEYVQANKIPKVQVNDKGEPILDAEGKTQPILDENGKIQYEYAQVSENAEEQKAFEAEVDRLQGWVETKITRLQEMEQQLMQAEAEKEAAIQQYSNMGYGYGISNSNNSGYGFDKNVIGYGAHNSNGTGYGYGFGVPNFVNGGYNYGSMMGYGNYSARPFKFNFGWTNGYNNLAYNYDNGRYDFVNMYNPFMMNYNNNIFAQKTEQ